MKRLLRIGVMLLGCTMISQLGGGDFFVEDVYAQPATTTTPTTTPTTTSTTEDDASKTELSIVIWLETILRVIYLIMRPLLALAGAAMDNSLVYGKIFNFTPALWKFWTIMRNFANFALGFLFLIAIFKTLFTGGSTSDLFGALKKLVLGAILVQISRFALSVLIDLSTVATVSIGGLPLYAVRGDTDYKKIRFLKPYGIFQMDKTANELATKAEHTVFYGCAGDNAFDSQYYIPCKVDGGKLAMKNNYVLTDPEVRASWKQQFIDSRKNIPIEKGLPPVVQEKYLTAETISDDFCVYGNSLIKNDEGVLLTKENLSKPDGSGLRDQGVKRMEDSNCVTLANLIQGSKGMSGPLFTLYASLLNTSELALSTNHKNIADLSLEFLMRVVMAILLFIPLLVFAIIMIMRVGYLRLIIAASPILVLMFVNDKKAPGGGITEKVANLSNILSLIFLPVIGTFAITLCVVFLSLIQRANFMRDVSIADLFDLSSEKSTTAEGGEVQKKCYDLKVTQLCFNESQRNAGNNIGDTFSYLLINAFGLALMWTVVFAALKSSAITEKVVDTVKGIGESALGAIPLLPTPYGMVSAKGAQSIGSEISRMPQQITNQQNSKLSDFINRIENSGDIDKTNEKLKTVATASDAKSAILNSNISGTGTDHKNYDNFFNALSKGGGSATVHSNLKDAFADPQNYKTYGMQGMQEILKTWNGSSDSTARNKYFETHGNDMMEALKKQSTTSGSNVVGVQSKSNVQYYFDTAEGTVATYDPSSGISVEKFSKEKTAGGFEKKTEVEEFVKRATDFGGVQKLKNVYPETTKVLNSHIGTTINLSTEVGGDVKVAGSGTEADTVTL